MAQKYPGAAGLLAGLDGEVAVEHVLVQHAAEDHAAEERGQGPDEGHVSFGVDGAKRSEWFARTRASHLGAR